MNKSACFKRRELTGDEIWNGRVKGWLARRFPAATSHELAMLSWELQSNNEQQRIAVQYGFGFGRYIPPNQKKRTTSDSWEAYIGALGEEAELDSTKWPIIFAFIDKILDNVYRNLRVFGIFPPISDPSPQISLPFRPLFLENSGGWGLRHTRSESDQRGSISARGMELTGDGVWNGRIKSWMVRRFPGGSAQEFAQLGRILQSNKEQKDIAISYGMNFGRVSPANQTKGTTADTFEAFIGAKAVEAEEDPLEWTVLFEWIDSVLDTVYQGLRPFGTFPSLPPPTAQHHLPFYPSFLAQNAEFENGKDGDRIIQKTLSPPIAIAYKLPSPLKPHTTSLKLETDGRKRWLTR